MSSGSISEIKVPPLGESIREATIARWLKSKGDSVKADEVLVELETDKVTLEVTAPASGILTDVFVEKGGTVAVGDVLGSVTEGGSSSRGEARPTPQAPKVDIRSTMASMMASATQKISSTVHKAAKTEVVPPSVRKMAEELKVDLQEVLGTGKGGRVTKEDILNLSEGVRNIIADPLPGIIDEPIPDVLDEPVPVQKPVVEQPIRTSDRREERVKMSRLRQRIAERLKEAQNTAAILTTFNEIDMSAITAIRGEFKESFEKKHGIRLGVMSFFVKACVQSLKEFPAVNSEIEGDEIIYKNYYDIGVAVSTPQGLVVPVVRNADLLSFAELEKEIATLAQKAKDGKLTIAEMTGGTFTVSNGGVFGSLLATPILNPPQTGILGMHKIEDRPVVINGKIEIRPMMYVALSYDHRVIDGRESVSFLVKVKEHLEKPELLMLDM